MLSSQIGDLITAFNEMRKQPGLNKKAINKTIARLEEAQLWSQQITNTELAAQAAACTCPAPGALDPNCPVHGNKNGA